MVDLCSVELVKLHLELTKMFKAKQEKPLCLNCDAFNLLILLPDFIVKECMHPLSKTYKCKRYLII